MQREPLSFAKWPIAQKAEEPPNSESPLFRTFALSPFSNEQVPGKVDRKSKGEKNKKIKKIKKQNLLFFFLTFASILAESISPNLANFLISFLTFSSERSRFRISRSTVCPSLRSFALHSFTISSAGTCFAPNRFPNIFFCKLLLIRSSSVHQSKISQQERNCAFSKDGLKKETLFANSQNII